MTFRIFSYSNGEPLDTVEMHVLAKAYRAAWRSRFTHDPIGVHLIEALDVAIDFGSADQLERGHVPTESPFGPSRRRDWG